MDKKYVYIISDYHEYGAQNVAATLDRSKLIDLLKLNWPPIVKWDGTEREYGGWHQGDINGLVELLLQSDESLSENDGNNLTEGWGGIQLHVVELDKKAPS